MLFSEIPADLFQIIKSYKDAKQHLEMQQKLNQAKSLEKIIALGNSNEDFRLAPPLSLNLKPYQDTLNDEILQEIIQLFPSINALLLTDCGLITDVGLENLKPLTKLFFLQLSWCNKISDVGLGHLQHLTNLCYLYLLGCDQITDAGLRHLQHLTNLIFLDLRGFLQFTYAGLAQLVASLTQLKTLGIKGNINIRLSQINEILELNPGLHII